MSSASGQGDEAMNSEDTQAVAQRAVKVLLISPFDEDHQHLRDILKHSNWQQHGTRTQREAFDFHPETFELATAWHPHAEGSVRFLAGKCRTGDYLRE